LEYTGLLQKKLHHSFLFSFVSFSIFYSLLSFTGSGLIFNLVASRPIHIFNYVITAFIKDHLREKWKDVFFEKCLGLSALAKLTQAVDPINCTARYQVGIAEDS